MQSKPYTRNICIIYFFYCIKQNINDSLFQIPNSTMLTNTSNNLEQPILPDTAFSHQAKNQCILGSDSNSHGFANNELENRIYEEVHMNEGNN